MVNVESTMNALLEQEDVDRDCLITVDDNGPKVRRIFNVSVKSLADI